MDCKKTQALDYYFTGMSSNDGVGEPDFDPQPHLARLKSGCLLLARQLDDPSFSHAIVLLCQHGNEGSYGLILNRPARMPLSEIFDLSELPEKKVHSMHKVYIGGPVQPEEIQVLQVADEEVSGAVSIAPEVHVGGQFQELSDILLADPQRLRLFLGYSGWGAGQLAKEVDWGAWEVWPGDIRKILEMPEALLMQGMDAIKDFLEET